MRAATEADIPLLRRLYDAGMGRYRLAAVRDEAAWRYELTGHHLGSVAARLFGVIERADGTPVGMVAYQPRLWQGTGLVVTAYELVAGESWLAATPSVLRALREIGARLVAPDATQPLDSLICLLATQHPAYEVASHWLPEVRAAYAWYVRVPDLPALIRRVAPALERRLAASPLAGHTGAVRISWYRAGLRLAFDAGRLIVAEPWQPTVEDGGDCAFPDRTFLQLFCGHRSFAELSHAFVDVWAGDAARVLLQALFPPAPSEVWGLG